MDFIVENYVWFIVGGIVILMAIIGYFADKTDFGRRSFEHKVKEPKTPTPEPTLDPVVEQVVEPVVEETIEEPEVVAEEKKDKKKDKKDKKKKKDKKEEKTKEDDVVNIDEMFNDPIISTDENLEDTSDIDEALFAPLEDTTNINVESNIEEQQPDFTEVNIEPLENEDLQPVSDEEDIWKF